MTNAKFYINVLTLQIDRKTGKTTTISTNVDSISSSKLNCCFNQLKIINSLIKNRIKRMAQPRIIRVRSSFVSPAIYETSTPTVSANKTSGTEKQKKRKLKEFRFETGRKKFFCKKNKIKKDNYKTFVN